MPSETDPLLPREVSPADVENARPQRRVSSTLQITVLMLVLLSEPITATVIFPFIAKVGLIFASVVSLTHLSSLQLVGEVGVAEGDPAAVGYYVGMIVRISLLTSYFVSILLNSVHRNLYSLLHKVCICSAVHMNLHTHSCPLCRMLHTSMGTLV